MTAEKDTGRRLWRLHTKIADEQGTSILFLGGRIGHAEAAELEFAALRHAAGPGDVVIDLSGVDYISSVGLRALMVASKGAALARGAVGRAGGVAGIRRDGTAAGLSAGSRDVGPEPGGRRLRLRAPSMAARLALDFSGLAGLIDD